LLRQTFDLSSPRGRFRELCAVSDQGTVEIARTVIKFAGADPMIDSSLSILNPRGTTHMVRFGDTERTVQTLTLITTTGGRRHHFGRLILSGLHVPDIIIPPRPKRTASELVHSAAR
jgi:threonine dehydrogenase-like Zn-dependent dehydrogenase